METASWEDGISPCAINAHADKLKMRPMSSSCVGIRGVQAVSDSFLKHNKELFFSMSELLDLLLDGVDQPQADQPNSLAGGLPM
eukprot:1158733-Pelagomonas_calceolata.AAC.1